MEAIPEEAIFQITVSFFDGETFQQETLPVRFEQS